MFKRCLEEKPLPPLPKSPPFVLGLPGNPREAVEKKISYSPIQQSEDIWKKPSTVESDGSEDQKLFENINIKEIRDSEPYEYDCISLQGEPVLPCYSRHDYWSFTKGLDPSLDLKRSFEQPKLGWKPITLRSPVLLTMTMVSLCFIAILQWLAHKSRANGGLLFAPSLHDVSARDTFIYLYAPVVIAVLYSIAWTWIDLDTKRLEPYLRLCHRDGARAADSISLNYATDFVALVPFKAARLRHWAVFSAGLALVTVFWAITPLTSAVFNLVEIPITSSVEIVDVSSLVPIGDQVNKLNANMFNDVYNYQWHNLSLPPFTTTNRVIIPFGISNNTNVKLKNGTVHNGTITSLANSYLTKLNCTPAQPIDKCVNSNYPQDDPGPGLSNGRGCNVLGQYGFGQNPGGTYNLGYTGWYTSAQGGSLSSAGCPCNNSRSTFLASWSGPQQMLSLFCDTSYFSQSVEVTVRAIDGSVLNVVDKSDPAPLDPRLLNTSNFEYLISTVVAALSESDTSLDGSYGTKDADIVDAFILNEQQRAIQGNNDSHLNLDIGGYALTAQGGNISVLGDPKTLSSAFEKAHQLLFTMAVPRLWLPGSDQFHSRQGSYTRTQATVTVDTIFASITSGVLLIVALLAIALLWISSKRPSYLCEDPASIIANMRLISGSFQEFVSSNSKMRTKVSTQKSFCIRQNPITTLPQIEFTQNHESQEMISLSHDAQPVALPMELRVPSLSILIAVLSTSIVGLCVLNLKITRDNGLKIPSENSFPSHAVLSYIPTAFATLLESCWVLLTRTTSYLWPFEELRRGNAMKRRTIDATYTSLPPQLILFGSLRNKHVTLSLLCVVAVLANLLSIVMSGLFQTVNTPLYHPILLTQGYEAAAKYSSALSNNEYDYVYTLASSMSGGNTEPPWTDELHVFNPFGWDTTMRNFSQEPVTGRSDGISLNVSCISVTKEYMTQGPMKSCGMGPYGSVPDPTEPQDSQRRLAAEFTSSHVQLLQNDTVGDGNGFLAAWCRTRPRADEIVLFVGNSTTPAVTGSAVICQAQYSKAEFNVTVDERGRVSRAQQITPYDTDVSQILSNASSSQSLIQDAFSLLTSYRTGLRYWHNNTAAGDWFNYLIKIHTQSSSLLDPELSLPEDSILEKQVEDVLERLFPVYAGLNPQLLFTNERTPNQTFYGTSETIEQRVFFSAYMFPMSVALLGLNLLVAVLLWIRKPKRYLEEMPTTIAAIGSYVAYSNLLAEVKHESMYGCETGVSKEAEVGFGKFIGTDGKPHVGIERHPLVTIL